MKGFVPLIGAIALVLLVFEIQFVSSVNVYGECILRGTVMNCENRNLTYIPAVPRNAKKLIFSGNFLPHITKSTFSNISDPKRLRSLHLKRTRIMSISVDSLERFSNLFVLDLSENPKIEHVDLKRQLGVLCNRRMLLFLESMGKDFPNEDTFSLMNRCKIRKISFWKNDFVNVSLNIMQHFDTIEQLDFTKNRISNIQFAYMENLKKISFNENELVGIPNFCSGNGRSLVPKLERLHLKNNFIHELHSDSFRGLSSLEYIDISENAIRFFPNDMLLYLPKIQVFLLRSIIDDGRVVKFEKYSLRSNTLQLLEVESRGYAESMFLSINDTFRYLPNLRSLSLSFINMKWTPISSFCGMFAHLKRLEKFSCFKCGIIDVPSTFLNGMKNLTRLHLSDNLIAKLSPSFLSAKHVLKDLRLTGNEFVHLTSSAFPVDMLNRFEVLELYENPFMCDCALAWFINWLKSSNGSRAIHREKYICASPPKYVGHKLLDVNFSYLECHPMTPWMWALIIGVPALLVLFVIAVIVYRNRWNIKHFMYLVRKRKNYAPIEGDDLMYDAFVSYNQKDSDWVVEQLIPKLENEHNCKLCIHERDFHVGAYINDTIVQRIEESKRMILILSDDFATSGWCMFELKMALSKHIEDDFEVIVVLLHMIKAKNMNGSIKTLLEVTTYLEWTDDAVGRELFWNKLTQCFGAEN